MKDLLIKTRVKKSQKVKIIVLACFSEVRCGVGVQQIPFKMVQ